VEILCTISLHHSVDILCTNLWTFCASFCGHSARRICDRGFATLSARCKTFFGSLSQHDTSVLQQGTSLLQHGGNTLPEGAVFLSCSTAAPVWPVFGLLLVSFCSFWAAFLACFLSAFSLLLACLGALEPALPCFGLFFPIWSAFFPAVFKPLWSASGPLSLLSPTFGAALVLSFFGPLGFFFRPALDRFLHIFGLFCPAVFKIWVETRNKLCKTGGEATSPAARVLDIGSTKVFHGAGREKQLRHALPLWTVSGLQKKIYKQQYEKPCWKNLAALQLWENWNHGELLTVAYCADVAFCLPGGTTVA